MKRSKKTHPNIDKLDRLNKIFEYLNEVTILTFNFPTNPNKEKETHSEQSILQETTTTTQIRRAKAVEQDNCPELVMVIPYSVKDHRPVEGNRYFCCLGKRVTLTRSEIIKSDPEAALSGPVGQSSQCAPYCDNVTWPRTTLEIIHVFLILSCPGMPGQGKVTNVYFVT